MLLRRRWILLAAVLAAISPAHAFRPPAVPLVVSDPYLSIWSEADRLTDDVTRHWTHHPHPLSSLIRIDGQAFRLMGNTPAAAPPLPQISVRVLPTRTLYDFENSAVHVTLTFMTPALPEDLDILARPLTYLIWDVRSVDGQSHSVSLFSSTSSLLAVNTPAEAVQASSQRAGDLEIKKVGTTEQPVLQSSGDDHRIDWGYACVAAPVHQAHSQIGSAPRLEENFVASRPTGPEDQTAAAVVSKSASPEGELAVAYVYDLGRVGAAPVSRYEMLAYDEVYSILYYGKKLRPYWRRKGAGVTQLFRAAERDLPRLRARCEAFDQELVNDLVHVGGAHYAELGALAYRQALGACGLAADANQQPLYFTKENTSNGDIATVDVIFPMHPVLLLLSPTLAKASLVPILSYAASSHWKFPNAPHDLGTYPIVTGRDDGGEGMPVEESGNMLLLCDAICKSEGTASFVRPWWPQLSRWAAYLERYGLDPENQLCTDDFMGHLAHNSNLSIKAILALAAYGDLCRMRGDSRRAARYRAMAARFANHWVKVADEGDHSVLAFDRPGTWSQKYNLVWDRILGLHIFPASVAKKEVAYYKKVMQPFGVPLDSRTHLTKTDWSLWSATLATSTADFESLITPVESYLDQTTSREPLVDSYVTDDVHSSGMHARPVVGGLFVKMLTEPRIWKKWVQRDHNRVGRWAPLPPPPVVRTVLPTGQKQPVIWRFTTAQPPAGWTDPRFDDSSWKRGPAGFGTAGTPNAVIRTVWNTADIWLRRRVTLPHRPLRNLRFVTYHDEDVEIYVDGVLASSESGFVTSYAPLRIRKAALELLKPGATVTLAVHCHQTTGGQDIDVGLSEVFQKE